MSAIIRNPVRNRRKPAPSLPGDSTAIRLVAATALLASLLWPWPGGGVSAMPVAASAVAEKPSATRAVDAQASGQNATLGCSPSELLARDVDARLPTGSELLNPASRVWAEAPALALRLARPRLLLADGVIAYAGNGGAAAAARADGAILLFAKGCGPTPCTLRMPDGHPAFALGVSANGGVVVAWAQGTGEFVFFDQDNGTAKSQALRIPAPLAGGARLALSANGQTLAAHDGAGALWVGLRGGEMRPLGRLQGNPALLGFSAGGGVLVVVEESGAGQVWNPRTGKPLRSFVVPGGPFVRGELASASGPESGQFLRLWTGGGGPLQWDLLRGEPATVGQDIAQDASRSEGTLQQRGQALFYVGEGRGWAAAPDYEQQELALSWSEQERCLRLLELDGTVRYYSAESGAPRSQCFAVDWRPVAIRPDGRAEIPGLALRVFDAVGHGPDGSQINARAISETSVQLWTTARARPSGPNESWKSGSIAVSQSAAVESGMSIPLRGGLAEEPATRFVRLGN